MDSKEIFCIGQVYDLLTRWHDQPGGISKIFLSRLGQGRQVTGFVCNVVFHNGTSMSVGGATMEEAVETAHHWACEKYGI